MPLGSAGEVRVMCPVSSSDPPHCTELNADYCLSLASKANTSKSHANRRCVLYQIRLREATWDERNAAPEPEGHIADRALVHTHSDTRVSFAVSRLLSWLRGLPAVGSASDRSAALSRLVVAVEGHLGGLAAEIHILEVRSVELPHMTGPSVR